MKISYEKHGVDGIENCLSYLAAFDSDDIDSDEFEIIGEDEEGRDGYADISIINLAEEACKALSAQRKRIAELEQSLERQAKAAISGMDAAKAVASSNLEHATRLHSECSPEALESERAANALLTERIAELEEREQALAAQVERLDNELQDKALTDDGVIADAYWSCADKITPWIGEETGADTLINSVCGSLDFLIEQWREKKALEQERDALAAHAKAVADAIGFPANSNFRSQTSVIVTNIQNCWRFAKYLHAIENKFFMVPGEPDEDYPDDEPEDECLVNSWGSTEEQYIDQFAKAIAIKQAEALEDALKKCESSEFAFSIKGFLYHTANKLRQRAEAHQ